MDFTSSVLARPGAPVIKQCPPAKSAMRICSMTSFCPTMTLASSASIRARPAMRRSTAARWAASGNIGGTEVLDSVVRLIQFGLLVGHRIKNDVDAERIGDFLGELF